MAASVKGTAIGIKMAKRRTTAITRCFFTVLFPLLLVNEPLSAIRDKLLQLVGVSVATSQNKCAFKFGTPNSPQPLRL